MILPPVPPLVHADGFRGDSGAPHGAAAVLEALSTDPQRPWSLRRVTEELIQRLDERTGPTTWTRGAGLVDRTAVASREALARQEQEWMRLALLPLCDFIDQPRDQRRWEPQWFSHDVALLVTDGRAPQEMACALAAALAATRGKNHQGTETAALGAFETLWMRAAPHVLTNAGKPSGSTTYVGIDRVLSAQTYSHGAAWQRATIADLHERLMALAVGWTRTDRVLPVDERDDTYDFVGLLSVLAGALAVVDGVVEADRLGPQTIAFLRGALTRSDVRWTDWLEEADRAVRAPDHLTLERADGARPEAEGRPRPGRRL